MKLSTQLDASKFMQFDASYSTNSISSVPVFPPHQGIDVNIHFPGGVYLIALLIVVGLMEWLDQRRKEKDSDH